MEKVRVGLLGSGFVSQIHVESYHAVKGAEVTAIWSRTRENAEALSAKAGHAKVFGDWQELVQSPDVDVVDICLPNFLHAPVTIAAARAGKHVIVEKPFCLNLDEADAMIEACRTAGVKLMYGEQLCFTPKYERVRQLVKEGAVGEIYQLRQAEKHSGPHSPWFWNVDQSGGGVLMDMGCHAFGWFRWMLGGNPRVKSVYATMSTVLHKEKTRGEDNSVAIVEFENGVTAIAEDSWAKHGGMDDRIEVYGTAGVSYADLFQGNSALTYSEQGYGYALEKASTTRGWTFSVIEEVWSQGYPHELQHFVDCVRFDQTPVQTGEDGKAVLEMMLAAYESARTGQKVYLPFRPKVSKPIDLLWAPAQAQ